MIEIFIFAFNRPDLFEYQLRCLNKFMNNDFRVHLIHDSRNNEFEKEFKDLCKNDNIIYHKHESEFGKSSSTYHSESLQYAYDEIVTNLEPNVCMFLDHDIFLVDELDLIQELKEFDILGLQQDRAHVKYIWPGLVAFKTSSFQKINWNCIEVEGQYLDTGGGTYQILRDKSIKYKNTGVDYPDEYKGIDLKNPQITRGYNFELHFDGKFLHSRNACNWDNYYNLQDSKKTDLLIHILEDVLSEKTKKELEIVVSRYNEKLDWTKDFSEYCTIYNKGEDNINGSIKLNNIGREGHTYLHHIVNNYNNLAEFTVFLQGDPFNPHSPNLISSLSYLIGEKVIRKDFIWISERLIDGDFEYQREPYHKIFPNIKLAYSKIFGEEPTMNIFTFGAGAQFCVSRNLIHSRPKSFYENILSLFETEEINEESIKLLGNPGINETFLPLNPELGLHLERFWGLIFLQ